MMPASRARPAQDRQILYADAYAHVEMCDGGTLVRIVRTARAHPDIETLRSSFSGLIHALDQSGRKARKMLYDTRAPVGRNDPAFEQEMARLPPGIDRGFARIAVLVRSAIGILQVRRWVSEDGVERAVGPDEQKLLQFLDAVP